MSNVRRYKRNIGDKVFAAATRGALGLCFAILTFLIGAIIWQGGKAISLEFLLMPAQDFGASGGIFYQIVGSLLLVIVAAVLVLPFAVGTALYRSEYVSSARRKRLIDLALYSLNAIPSVTYGVFGLILFVNIFGTGISWFVGSIILAMMMLPTVTITAYQSMQAISDDYRENAAALGLTRAQQIRSVILPQSLHGIVTGLLIGLARAIGETAPIMFIATAFSGVSVPRSLLEPVASLPTHILALAQQATNPDALRNAWGASLTLIMLVMLFSMMAYYARFKLMTFSRK
ncbi:MAG: phosphate ABC transporter permease PstA [Litorimonas sp.]